MEKIKVRSSANAEDIPNFDGAGLHDSFAADTDKRDRPIGSCLIEEDDDEEGGEVKRKVKPKSVGCAVKGVYASLWNKRAIEERFFARIDQTDIAMGLAIVPAYDLESEIAANTVVVTRVLNTDDVFGYSLSVQQGNNLVTNPDPGTHSEVTIAAFIADDEPTSLTVTRFAKPTPDAPERTEPVLSTERMLELVEVAKAVEGAYCRAKPGYYPDCRFVTSANDKDGRPGPGGQDPGERPPGLQAGPRVRRPLTLSKRTLRFRSNAGSSASQEAGAIEPLEQQRRSVTRARVRIPRPLDLYGIHRVQPAIQTTCPNLSRRRA